MTKIYPHVNKFMLMDNSQIYCSKTDKMSLAYDYILKYNQTWYQKKFAAELPGHNTISQDSLLYYYVESLKELDAPLIHYSIILEIFPTFTKYQTEYISSQTPRMFIDNIREKYKDTYYQEVSKWLNSYMKYLHIKISPEHWFILSRSVIPVPNFKATKLRNNNITKIFGGGSLIPKHDGLTLKRGTFTESIVEI
jgi:hypothetical protein